MKCQVTLRAHGVAHQWDLDEWSLVVILAALSADPETFSELASALRRYQPAHELFEQGRPVAAEGDAISIDAPAAGVFPGEASWCLIDLVGRTVVAGGGLELPEFGKAYEPEEETAASLSDDPPWVDSGVPCPVVWLDLADTWLFRAADDHWQAVVAARAKAMERQPRSDTRQVLFGVPLLQFLAERVISIVAAGDPTGKSSLPGDRDQAARMRKIHAEWLMTACDDLGGVTPRQVLLADHDRIQRDLEHRAVQWTMQGFAPPALPGDSAAYCLGLYGVVEVIQYFDLIRALLDAAWRLVKSDRSLAPDMLVQHLATERDRWLATPNEEEDANEIPAEWIESERRRMPITEDGLHLDCDCPICQMISPDQAGPMFCWLDGHHLEMEDEFAFSLTRLRCDWELERGELEQGAQDVSSAPGAADLGPDCLDESGGEDLSVWQSSFVDWEQVTGPGSSEEMAKSAIVFPLAELVDDLKERTGGRVHLERLNETFRALHSAQDQIALDSAAAQLRDCLEEMAQAYPELVSKSADLQSRLDEVLRQLDRH